MKKCLIVYDSCHHGNTKKIASAMAEACGAELCTADEINGKDLSPYDLIGFGSGIAYGKPYEKLRDAVSGLSVSGKTVFAFCTSGCGNKAYGDVLSAQLKAAGATAAGTFSCKGFDTYGPFKLVGGIAKGHPDDADIKAAKEFILGLTK